MMAFHDLAVDLDPSVTPGALQTQLRREVPGGLVEFEQAPAGWLTKKGERRKTDWRAYFWTPDGGKRARMTSVTTVLSGILPAGGLVRWSEARGIEGAIEAVRLGIIDPADLDSAAMAVELVRAHRLGADRARDDAADRGLNVHALLEQYMVTGAAPRPEDHPVEHAGYIRALVDWLAAVDPEPIAVEELVCDPEAGYAGRYDVAAVVKGQTILFDAKTQASAAIFDKAHIQVEMYRRALRACGDGEVDGCRVVVFAADGQWREMDGHADGELVEAALAYSRLLKRVTSACESANRRERKAREVVA